MRTRNVVVIVVVVECTFRFVPRAPAGKPKLSPTSAAQLIVFLESIVVVPLPGHVTCNSIRLSAWRARLLTPGAATGTVGRMGPTQWTSQPTYLYSWC